ncbi:glycosyl hydrolase family 28-related protein [Sinorhizobium meliloti]|uniref:glycosyl hydrolase family 28-related protein n=1 Tax=Rhizobium meliloti TaxID=382 RepID=UPI00398D5CC0
MAVPYHTHTFEIPVASDAEAAAGVISDKVVVPSNLGTAAVEDASAFATAAQGALADSSVQPADLATVATSGAYADLSGKPTLGTAAAANTTDFATAAQGATADTALQPAAIGASVQAHSANLDTLAGVIPGPAGTSILALSLAADVRNFLDTAPYAATRAALKALDTGKDTTAILTEAGREGIFNWKSGDYSTQIATDTREGVYVKADDIAATAGAWVRVHDGKISPKWFGAAGDGVTDDYPAIQAMFDLASAVTVNVHISTGTYYLDSGSPEVFSNCTITGDGKGKSILVQPNYFTYNRGVDPYVRGDVVDWNALWMDIGTSNVDISGLELRGPFYQSSEAGYTANPVENWPANNGIHVRGADYQYRQGLPFTGESFNIRIHDCHLEGWAEDAIQTDMVTHVWVERNTIARCGRGGHRGYSCVHAWTQFNSVENLSPGDYLNNGNRMYGVEYTRTYQSGVRASSDFWIVGNRIRNCLQWKGIGSHGGERGNILFNDIFDCHHGIGIDKGGFEVADGISPPRDMRIMGNRIRRSAASDPTEGNGEGGAGHALFIVAHNGTSTHIGRNLVIGGNILEGWGSENLNGGAWIGNWDGVVLEPNVWRDSFGSAIRLRDTVTNINIGPQSFVGVTRSAGGNQRAISVENGGVTGAIGPQVVENTSATALTAVFLNNPDSGKGLLVQDGHSLTNSGGGSITECNIPANDRSGPLSLGAMAVGSIAVAVDDTVTISGHRNITSAVRNSEGTFTVTISKAGTSTSTIFPIASSTGGSLINCQASAASTTTITVLTKNASGTLTDGSFILHVFGY